MLFKSKYLPVIFVVLTMGFLVVQRMNKPRILILQSYSTKMNWVNEVDDGLNSIFDKTGYISLRRFYLNTKQRNTFNDLYHINQTSIKLINRWQPNVIIAVDDYAQILAAKYYINHPKIKIIFAGIGDSYRDYGYQEAKNVTGVVEHYAFPAIKEILPLLFPHKEKLYYLSDQSKTATLSFEQLNKFNWQPFQLRQKKEVMTFKQWKIAVKSAQKKADILLIGTYYIIREKGKVVPSKTLVKWTITHSRIPVIGLGESFVDNGGYIAIAPSGKEQGKIAAEMALQVINQNKTPDDIPILKNSIFQITIRASALKRHLYQHKIPLLVKALAKSTNSFLK